MSINNWRTGDQSLLIRLKAHSKLSRLACLQPPVRMPVPHTSQVSHLSAARSAAEKEQGDCIPPCKQALLGRSSARAFVAFEDGYLRPLPLDRGSQPERDTTGSLGAVSTELPTSSIRDCHDLILNVPAQVTTDRLHLSLDKLLLIYLCPKKPLLGNRTPSESFGPLVRSCLRLLFSIVSSDWLSRIPFSFALLMRMPRLAIEISCCLVFTPLILF